MVPYHTRRMIVSQSLISSIRTFTNRVSWHHLFLKTYVNKTSHLLTWFSSLHHCVLVCLWCVFKVNASSDSSKCLGWEIEWNYWGRVIRGLGRIEQNCHWYIYQLKTTHKITGILCNWQPSIVEEHFCPLPYQKFP